MEPIHFLETRVEETIQRIKDKKDCIAKQTGELKALEDILVGYQRVLDAERKLTGEEEGLFSEYDVPVEFLPAKSDLNKAEFARKFLRTRPQGARPVDIYQGFLAAGIPITKPYVYALVQRLRKQEVIRQRRGKWYPTPDESSVNGISEKALP